MVRRSKREIERALSQLEGDDDLVPGLCYFMSAPRDSPRLAALQTATEKDWEAQRTLGLHGPLIVVTPVVQLEFLSRLSHTLYDLRAETGIHIPVATYLQYIHGRVEGEIPAGEDGAAFFEEDVSAEDVDRIWSETVRKASPGPAPTSIGACESGGAI